MTRRAGFLAAPLALACAALAQAASSPSVTIELNPRAVGAGQKVNITGRVTPHTKRRLVLEVSEFPFQGGFTRAASTTTTAHGFYSFKGSPGGHANRLRVRTKDGSARSRVVTVYVVRRSSDFSCTLEASDGATSPCQDSSLHGKLKLHFSFHLRYPASVYGRESSKPVHIYWGQRNGSNEHPDGVDLRKTVAQHPIGHHRTAVRATFTVHIPSGPWSGEAAGCTRWSYKSDGFGLPHHHGCGAQHVSYGTATSYKFG